MHQPFWRNSRKAWYLQVGKTQVKLAENKAEAWAKWHEIMSESDSANSPKTSVLTVGKLVDLFLEDCKRCRSQKTWQWYVLFMGHFTAEIKPSAPVLSVRVSDINRIVSGRDKWKPNTRHNFVRAVKRIYHWAEVEGLIESDPLKHLKCPTMEARTEYVTQEQMDRIENSTPESVFKDLLRLAWDTGMRPQEIVRIEARHFNAQTKCIMFPREESKGKRHPRTIYLGTERAFEIVAEYCKANPIGPIFLNTKGQPYCKNSLICAMTRLAKKTGIKTHLGAFRKGYCTEALQNGVDPITLSKLMGHADLTMINRVYAQVAQNRDFMLASAQKAKGL